MRRFCLNIFGSVFVVIILYLFLWRRRFGDWTVKALEYFMKIGHEQAFYIYHSCFREYKENFFAEEIILVFVLMIMNMFSFIKRYIKQK